MSKSIKCPVCGQSDLLDDGDVCPVCKWFRDRYQEEFPDEEDCQNHMSLNQAREAWAHGKRVDEDICPVCNWEEDADQEEYPDEENGANRMSLNQAREAWKNGKQVE